LPTRFSSRKRRRSTRRPSVAFCGNSNLAGIAAEIGYESEAAFSRAFKKMIGVPPSAWRLGVRVAPDLGSDETSETENEPVDPN
jgi:AraC-like DNA-binding protein